MIDDQLEVSVKDVALMVTNELQLWRKRCPDVHPYGDDLVMK